MKRQNKMIDGVLKKSQKGWTVQCESNKKELVTHPEHNMWLKVFAKEDMKVCFEVETIATGANEFDVLDMDVARLKACFPDQRTYSQD